MLMAARNKTRKTRARCGLKYFNKIYMAVEVKEVQVTIYTKQINPGKYKP